MTGGRSGSARVTILLAVALVTGVVVLLLLPAFVADDHARDVKCRSRLKQLGYACRLYAKDHAGAFPPRLGSLFPSYITQPELFVCGRLQDRGLLVPHKGPSTGPLPEASTAFCYVAGLRSDDAEGTIFAFGEEWNHDGIRVHFMNVGGAVGSLVDADHLHAQLAKQAAELEAQGREVRLIRPPWSRWPERADLPPVPWDRRKAVPALVVGAAALVVLLVAAFLFHPWKRRRA